ncbi:hypothetical protein KIPB_014421, partial [Kipferlia bialata]
SGGPGIGKWTRLIVLCLLVVFIPVVIWAYAFMFAGLGWSTAGVLQAAKIVAQGENDFTVTIDTIEITEAATFDGDVEMTGTTTVSTIVSELDTEEVTPSFPEGISWGYTVPTDATVSAKAFASDTVSTAAGSRYSHWTAPGSDASSPDGQVGKGVGSGSGSAIGGTGRLGHPALYTGPSEGASAGGSGGSGGVYSGKGAAGSSGGSGGYSTKAGGEETGYAFYRGPDMDDERKTLLINVSGVTSMWLQPTGFVTANGQ